MIGAEIDGPGHDEPDVRRNDQARDADLAAIGWRIFRIRWRDFELDPITAVAPLLEALWLAHDGTRFTAHTHTIGT
jgi:very-short-patch-repair endonuclease